MKAIILAGGSGTRLWPLSRRHYPKQFLKLNPQHGNSSAFQKGSLIQQTLQRLLNTVSPEDIIIITNNEYRFHVLADVRGITADASKHIVLEPAARNTAPAIALAMRYCKDVLGCDDREILFVTPSDHIIGQEDRFSDYLHTAVEAASDGGIITFGIKPLYPETGYGYIRPDREIKSYSGNISLFKVKEFMEKPDSETAKEYVDRGYLWNSGMFIFNIATLEEEIRLYIPEIYDIYKKGYNELLKRFPELPNISIDYAVVEKSRNVFTIPMDIYWNDVGSWDSMFDAFQKDSHGNVKLGDVIIRETRNSFIMSDKRLIATVGLEDMLVVETDDAILIAKRGHTQKVKEIVEQLNSSGRQEASLHTTVYRPWGQYTVLEKGHRYKIKRVVVNPGEKLSLQMHHHRSEHWVVIRGTAKVTIGPDTRYIHENESVYIPKSTLHRLENPGKVPLEIIEVQNGEYVEEDDIVRVDDQYGRE